MRRLRTSLSVIALLTVLSMSIFSVQAQESSLLTNPGFEPPLLTTAGLPPMQVADGWLPWFSGTQPQFYAASDTIEGVGVPRVLEGDGQQYFSYYNVHTGGVYQSVAGVTPDTEYTFGVNAYVWSTNGDDPDVSADPGGVIVQVGIDPDGGTDGTSADIVWSAPIERYDAFNLYTVTAVAAADTISVWVRSSVTTPVQYSVIYLDNASLETISLEATAEATIEGTAEATDVSEATDSPEATETAESTDVPVEATDAPAATDVSESTDSPEATATEAGIIIEMPDAQETVDPVVTMEAIAPLITIEASPEVTAEATIEATEAVDVTPTVEPPTETPTVEPPTVTPLPPTEVSATTEPPTATVVPVTETSAVTTEPPTATGTLDTNEFPYSLVHTVQNGDSIYELAILYNSTTQAIFSANQLNAQSIIFVGQGLVIPLRVPPTALTITPEGQGVVIQPGDGGLDPLLQTATAIISQVTQTAEASLQAQTQPTETATPLPTLIPVTEDPANASTEAVYSACYFVQPGDTLASIAFRLNTTVRELVRANNIANINLIYVGQCIRTLVSEPATVTPVPTATPVVPTATQATSTVIYVGFGDTLYGIAVRYGVTVRDIIQSNNLANPNVIYVGQRLVIPQR
ncbi:MAG: LysM peptidoglycan-binding domain-containing protein [bacterium]|nr:LysM peptidoglycan-binding domain-containing protein [bacterium]